MNLQAATETGRQQKKALRDELRRRRSVRSPVECQAAGVAAAALLERLLVERLGPSGGVVLASLFAALPGEIDTLAIEQVLLRRGAALAWPRVDGAQLFLHAARRDQLSPAGKFQILEPPPSAPPVEPAELDLVIVPGLGFDAGGGRIGFGRGHYDRLLAAAPRAWRIAPCFDDQLLPDIPTEPHDERVDHLLVAGGSPRVLPTCAARPGGPAAVPHKEIH